MLHLTNRLEGIPIRINGRGAALSSSKSIQSATSPTEMTDTPPLLSPSRCTRWPPHLCPMPSLSPFLCLLKNGNNLAGALKSLGFLHLSWASNTAPIFYELRRSLIDSRACPKLSSDLFNRHIMSYSGGASTWTRSSGLAKVLSNDAVAMLWVCLDQPGFIVGYVMHRKYSLSRKPRG